MSDQAVRISCNNVLITMAALAMVFYLGLMPLYKYGEYVYGLPRVNATLVNICLLGITLFILLLRVALGRASYRNSLVFWIAVGLLLWVCLLQIVQIPILLEDVDLVIIGKYISRTFFAAILLFFIGVFLFEIMQKKGGLVLGAWLLSVVVYFLGFIKSSSVFIYLDGEQIYLMLADAFAVLSIVSVFLMRNTWIRCAIFLVSLFVLFTLVSRTSFFLFAFTFFLYLARSRLLLFAVALTFSTALIILLWPLIVDYLGESNRMIRIFTTGEDSSWAGRMRFLEQEYEYIKENWVLGQFMYDVVATGVTGTYAHNFLSFLTAFGIFPFLALVCFMLYLLGKSVIKVGESPFRDAYICCLLFVFMEIVVARSYLHPYVWMILGGAASFCRVESRATRSLMFRTAYPWGNKRFLIWKSNLLANNPHV